MSESEVTRRLVGTIPRADLLPRALLQRVAVRATRRIVVLLIILSLAVVAAGIVGATLLRTESQRALATEQERILALQARQAEFADLRLLQRITRDGSELIAVPLADRLDWSALIATAVDPLPANATVTSVTFVADTPVTAVEQSTGPFDAPSIGTIEISMLSTELETLTAWLDRMRAEPAFSEVRMSSIVHDVGWSTTAVLSLAAELTAVSAEEASS